MAFSTKRPPKETIERLSKRYASFLRDGEEDDDMDVLEIYLNALTNAYDPHSDYMEPEEAQDFNIQAINHAVKGIGAVLRSDDGYATIEEVIPGGPADLDKRLQAGDRILAVGQGTDKPVDAVYHEAEACGRDDPRPEGEHGPPRYSSGRRHGWGGAKGHHPQA